MNRLFLFLFFLPLITQGQTILTNYQVKTAGILNSNSKKSFHLLSNNYGKFRANGNTAFINLKWGSEDYTQQNLLFNPPPDTNTSFHLDYGLELMNTYNGSYHFLPIEYFAEASWKGLHVTIGAKKQSFGLQYDPLSSGGLLYSGNARPIPEMAISSEYIKVPFTKGLFEIKGYFSHGWFEKERAIKSPFYHHKNLYARLGKKWPVSIEYGFEHYAMWGGKSPDHGRLNNNPDDFLKVILAKSGDQLANEIKNVYGNHLGSQNLKLSWNHSKFTLSATWQTLFEDGSGKRMENIKDGLWRIHFQNNTPKASLQNISLEYFHSKHQSGRYHVIDSSIAGGNDNYFNNYLYNDGWTYHDYILGTPFISSPALLDNAHGTINNRVIMFHLGLNGYLSKKLNYRALISWSENHGTYNHPFSSPKNQLSTLLALNYLLPFGKNWHLGALFAHDAGQLLASGTSVMLSISKSGSF